jgi:hypothetical protein
MLLTNDKNACPMRSNRYYYPDSLSCTVSTSPCLLFHNSTFNCCYTKKYKLIALLLLFVSACLFAQTNAAGGIVSEPETGKLVAGASIKIVHPKPSTVTDNKDCFKIDAPFLLGTVLKISDDRCGSQEIGRRG